MKPTKDGSYAWVVIANSVFNKFSKGIIYWTDGNLYYYIGGSLISLGLSYYPSQWIHFAIENDETGQRIYVNGTLVKEVINTIEYNYFFAIPVIDGVSLYIDAPIFTGNIWNNVNITHTLTMNNIFQSYDMNLSNIQNFSLHTNLEINDSNCLIQITPFNFDSNNFTSVIHSNITSLTYSLEQINRTQNYFNITGLNLIVFGIDNISFWISLSDMYLDIQYIIAIEDCETITITNNNTLNVVNEFMLYLCIFTIINICLAKIFSKNKYLHIAMLFIIIALALFAMIECDEKYLLSILSIMIFNIILSMFMISINIEKKRR
jgi:hypothetical protein